MFLSFSLELEKEREPLQSEKILGWYKSKVVYHKIGYLEWCWSFDSSHFRPCPAPSGIFSRKFPQTLHFSWMLFFISSPSCPVSKILCLNSRIKLRWLNQMAPILFPYTQVSKSISNHKEVCISSLDNFQSHFMACFICYGTVVCVIESTKPILCSK